MLLRKSFGFGLAAATIAALGASACGGSSDDDGGTGQTGTTDKNEDGAKWPAAPGSGSPGTGSTTIALNKLFLGETDRNAQPDSNAWRDYGYNIDNLISTKTGKNHCKAQQGTPKSKIQTDGTNGIDNSFGGNLIPIIGTLAADPSKAITETLQDGSFTLMFKLDNFDAGGGDQTGVAGGLFGGAGFDSCAGGGTFPGDCPALDCATAATDPNCSAPAFDGTDVWPVVPELLTGNEPKVKFAGSYYTGGTWVSGDGSGDLNLTVSIQGFELTLKIARAVITAKIGTDGSATDGIIAGVIPTESLISELKKVAGGFDTNLCEGPTFDSIANQIRGASDIMQDGSNGDSAVECNGISVGLGFEGKAVTLGGIAPVSDPPEDPCATPQ
jgi:hypothetical protein